MVGCCDDDGSKKLKLGRVKRNVAATIVNLGFSFKNNPDRFECFAGGSLELGSHIAQNNDGAKSSAVEWTETEREKLCMINWLGASDKQRKCDVQLEFFGDIFLIN